MKKVLLYLMFCFSISVLNAQTEVEKVTSTVTQDEIRGHIYFLADDLLQGRATGTRGNKIAASYLANTLRGYGVKPEPKSGSFYQDVVLKRTKFPQTSLILNGKSIDNLIALRPAELNYNAEMVFLNYGLKEDYSGKNVKGKLVLVKGGNSEASDPISSYKMSNNKIELAQQAGAVGVVEIVKAADSLWQQIEHSLNSDKLEVNRNADDVTAETFPYIWVNENRLEMNDVATAGNNLKADLKIGRLETDTIVSKNVVGFLEGTDPSLKNEYIIYSAHFDHVGIGAPDATGDSIYNGARDNAVGTATVLSMAENLSIHPSKRSALFVFFTGEEAGLLGSRYFAENPVVPLEQIVYVFNSDNAGYNDTSIATIFGLERTTAAPHIKKAASTFGITAIDDPAPEQNLFDRSDNVSFAAKGIPAPTFSLGFRSFDGEVTQYYHQPGDEAETVDYDYLFKFFQTYVLAGRLIANDPVTHFWVPGDKYEAAGKELYNKP